MGVVEINGIRTSSLHLELLKGGYAELLKPAEMKEWVSNDNPTEDGVQYIAPDTPKFKERVVNLTFLLSGQQVDLALKEFMWQLTNKGLVTLYVEDLNKTFTLKYQSCTTFDYFNNRTCKVAVKFIEPIPINYSE